MIGAIRPGPRRRVLDVLRERCRRTRADLCHEPHPTLRLPVIMEVSVR
ncbi:hypothetical protein [Micromonospora tarensis]|uniref:Uncharacterized protein n=1 Tax=Micromonospora tarensis TaxID=2806100 RepID=A0ABS1YLM8_9ACTN|nr:hypothetical protein [Micromonospora tarensis]MBM0278340.1 hypothetical protein [Micromonospora tarensis]